MKLYHAGFIVIIASGLLSGCAYMQGRKDEQNAAAMQKLHGNQSGHVIVPQGPPAPSSNTTPSASQTASKMIAPITQQLP